MSKINTNVSSLIAQRVLRGNNDRLNMSLERLSTGLKINRGADNPAGLIASENLRAEKKGIETAIENAQRASNIIGTAEGGLTEISSLLIELQGLVGQAANSGGLSEEEVAANQLQVDSILSSINRIAGSTAFQGTKLLNGNYSYTTSSVSGVNNLAVNAARLPDAATITVNVAVTTSARVAQLGYTGGTLAADNAVTVQITGVTGSEEISLAGGSTIDDMVSAINSVKESTGVSASTSSTSLRLSSIGYGEANTISVQTVSGTFAWTATTAEGRNAAVKVNGADASAAGTTVSFRSSQLDVEFDLADATNTTNGATTFYVTGGGATFSLGPKVSENNKASLGIINVSSTSLGLADGKINTLASGQTNSLSSGNLVQAQRILDRAIKQVAQMRGRLGAFQKFTLGTTIASLGVAYETVSASESAIRDTDFAEETAALTRSQILAQAATTVLAQANSSPQSALALLRG